MQELQVKVEQQPGVISWNFEDLKVALATEMESYKGLVYTDKTIPSAKADLAMLRKLRTSVETRRKEIKNKCLEPYEIIEKQAKELTGLIDAPIDLIDSQVKEYEQARKEKVKLEIQKYMAQAFNGLPDAVIKKLVTKTYDDRWENATAKKKEWKDAIDKAAEATKLDVKVLSELEDDFRVKAFEVYEQNLVLSEALQKVTELNNFKQETLERERKKKEEEERRRLEEAQRKTYDLENEAVQRTETAQISTETQNTINPIPTEEKPPETHLNEPETEIAQNPELKTVIFRVIGTKEQINDCFKFIKANSYGFAWKEAQK